MDPNETLDQIRKLVSGNSAVPLDRKAELLAEHFEALDEWLSRGEPFPQDWGKGRLSATFVRK